MKNNKDVFNLFANCIPVKGKNRSIICDIYRSRFRYIPNALYYILTNFKKHTIDEVKTKFNHEYDEFINEYFSFLEKNEFIFYCSKQEQKLFPKLNIDFDFPSLITNCIIDFDNKTSYNLHSLFQQLTELNCNYWQMRFFGKFNLDDIYNIVCVSQKFSMSSIHIILPYHPGMNKTWISKLYNFAPLSQIDFYNFPKSKIAKWEKISERLPFKFYSENLSDQTHCGNIAIDYFSANINTFGESKKFNSCLNKKIGIDVNGNIKNCPSMNENFGNINETTLEAAIKKKGFKKYWNVTKDQISVCRDCEFRHICTDCRAYIENPIDMFSKPLKCGYDPNTNKWEDWSVNPLKKSILEFYKMKDMNIH